MKPKTRQLNNLKFVLDAIPKAEAIQGRHMWSSSSFTQHLTSVITSFSLIFFLLESRTQDMISQFLQYAL